MEPENKEEIAQTDPALQSPAEQGPEPEAPEKPASDPTPESPSPIPEPNSELTPPIVTQPPKKTNKVLIIVLAVLLLAAIGAAVYFLLNNTKTSQQANSQSEQNPNEQTQQKADETNAEQDEPSDRENDEESKNYNVSTDVYDRTDDSESVKNIIGKLANELSNRYANSNIDIIIKQAPGDGSTIIIPNTNIKTSTDLSYELNIPAFQGNDPGIADVVKTVLGGEGFTFLERFDPPINWISLYYNPEKDIYCDVPESSQPYDLSCTKTTWLSDEKRELVLTLEKAAGDIARKLVDAKPSDIEDSPISPYQRLRATTNGAWLLFYRNSPSSEWHYISVTQMDGAYCGDYNDDAKKAFSGTKCYDETTKSYIEL